MVVLIRERYDTGPIIIQRTVEILDGDTPATLAARVLPQEHSAYVEAVQLFSEDRIHVESGRVKILPAAREISVNSERGF